VSAPDPSGLTGRSVSHFRVLEPLGAGGMGVVYRAEDVTLGRTVALKFMLPNYTIDDTAEARFLREARSVAALDHPNICTVHEAGTSEDGLLYLAMAYYPGETLQGRLTRLGALSVEQALDIAAQIARGLACAHAVGIIHRDLKPANVMLTTDGTVKILDFGLAKTRDQTMTASGVLMGTVAYMSPEQLVGVTDARSDLWSLGVMLVEMLTARHPSTVDDLSATLTRQIEARTRDVIGPVSTTALVRIVERLMRRDPDERYQSATEVAHDMSALAGRAPAGIGASARAAGIPVRRVALGIGAAALVIAGAIGVTRWAERARSSDSPEAGTSADPLRTHWLAVLPLRNYGGPDQEYFADGMTDELTSTLTKIEALHVIAHQSVLQFKQSTLPASEIAAKLGVKYLLGGSVRQDSAHIKIAASLIDAARNTPVWSDDFVRDRRDVVALQRDVALAVARAIQATLTPRDQARLAPARALDPEAFNLYLKGTHLRDTANTTGAFSKAVPYLTAAIARDSDYAAAYAGLASVYVSTNDTLRARAFSEKALALDSTLAEGHMVRGMIRQFLDWDLKGSEQSFREAIRLNPGFAEAHHELSMLLQRVKRFDDALREGREAVAHAPLSLRFINGIGEVLLTAGREADALAVADQVLTTDSTFSNAYQIRGVAYEQLGQWDQATKAWVDCLRVTPSFIGAQVRLGYIAGRTGDTTKANTVLRALEARVNKDDHSGSQGELAEHLAAVHMALGNRAQALTWLERAVAAHSGSTLYLAVDRTYTPLHNEPRFRALLEKIGLPTS
jgi:eukaryotic-like serine/threonine-protein kinase